MSPEEANFFTRNHYSPSTKSRCWEFARARYPAASIHEASPQGYCSYTLSVYQAEQHFILQFRPQNHSVDNGVAILARDVYHTLAPRITRLGAIPLDTAASGYQAQPLVAFVISRIPGRPLSEVSPAALLLSQRESLVAEFAHIVYTSWLSRLDPSGDIPKRRIGATLGPRLAQLSTSLPFRFRPVAAEVLARLPEIEALPWVFSHGDLVPSNIMVTLTPAVDKEQAEDSLHLAGLVDWAEAEYLPLGVSLYGLEELLGTTTNTPILDPDPVSTGSSPPGQGFPAPQSIFTYYPDSGHLRNHFWTVLSSLIPELASDPGLVEGVKMAGVAGILLWHGFAFDEGRLDRVVQEGRDDEEVQRLDVMLSGQDILVPN